MSQTHEQIAQLEREVQNLREQLEQQTQENVLPAKALNSLFAHGREVVLYVVNDERITVKSISESISTYGYAPEDFTSGKLGWRDVLYPDDYKSLAKHIGEQITASQESFEHEHRIFTKSGEVVWIAGVSTPKFNADGEVTHFLIKIKDITRHKQYEKKLQDANENLFVTLKSIGEAVILANAEGYIERLNVAAEKLVGIINLKAKRKRLNEVIRFSPSADFTTLIDPLKAEAETRKPLQFDDIFMQSSIGSKKNRVSCNVSPIYIGKDKDRPTGFLLVIKDRTDTYNMLQSLQEGEDTMRGIFDYSVDGILLADQKGIIREWSKGYERITGVPKEDAIGKTIWEVVSLTLPAEQQTEEERANLKTEVSQVITDMQQKMLTRRVVNQQTGEYKILHVLYFPVSVPGKVMMGAISRDVTEEMRSQELIHQNEQKLIVEMNRLQTLGDNMPNGCLYRTVTDPKTLEIKFVYLGGTFEHILNIPIDDALNDFSTILQKVHPDDLSAMVQHITEAAQNKTDYNDEVRFIYSDTETRWIQISSHPHMEDEMLVYDGFILDVTARKLAEQETLAEKERLEALGNNLPNGCLLRFTLDTLTQEMKLAYVSKTWETILGIPAKDALKDINVAFNIVHPDDLPIFMNKIQESAKTLENFNVEVRAIVNGETKWMNAATHPHLEDHMIVWDGFILDITDRKVAEQALVEERDRLQTLDKNFPDGCLFRYKMDTETLHAGFTYLGQTWTTLTGIPVKDTLTNFGSSLEKMHPDDLPGYRQKLMESASNMSNFYFEYRFLRDDGQMVWLQTSSTPRREEKNIIWEGFMVNITERKLAEQKLVAEKDRLQALGDYFPNGCLFRFNYDGENRKFSFSYLSKTWEKLTGLSLEAGLHDMDLVLSKIHPDDVGLLVDRAWKTYDGQQDNFDAEFRFLITSNDMRWFQISTHRHNENGQVVSDGFILDITSRKNAEQQLLDEKERLEALGNNLPDGTLFRYRSCNLQEFMVFDYVSATWEKVTGVSAEDTLKDVRNVFAHVHPDDFPDMMKKFDDSAINMANLDTEARYLHPDGSMRWLHIASHPHHEGEFVVSDGYLIDVTDRKIAEEELANEQKRLKSLTDNVPNGCLSQFVINPKTQKMRMSYMSNNWESITNTSIEEAKKDSDVVFKKIYAEDLPRFMTEVIRTTNEMVPFNIETRYWYSDGDLRWIQISSAPHQEGESVIFDGVILDITDRKRADQELISEKERLQSLGDNFPNGTLFRFVFDVRTQGMTVAYLSETWNDLTGVPREEAMKDVNVALGRVLPEDLPIYFHAMQKSVAELSRFDVEVRYMRHQSEIRWIQISSQPRQESGNIICDGFMLDITDRKTAEYALFAEKERLQALGDNFPNGTLFRFKMDLQTETMSFDYVSGTWETLSGVSIADTLSDINLIFGHIVPEDMLHLREDIYQSVQSLENIDTEIRYQHPDGSKRWYQISSHPHQEGDVVYSDGFILDITSRKKAEREASLEKERLQALGDNFPNGTLFRFKMDLQTEVMSFDYVSGTWEKAMGVSAESALTDIRSVFALVVSDDLPYLMEEIRKSIYTLNNIDVEIRYNHPDGTQRWFQVSSHPHYEGNIAYSDGFILDITERKRIEQQLMSEKERIEALGNNIPDGCLFRFALNPADNSMSMMYVSTTWGEVTGVPADIALKDFSAVLENVYPDDLPHLIEAIEENAQTMSNFNMEVRFHLHGNVRWIQLTSRPHRENNLIVWDGILLDITWRKDAERKLIAEKERLEALGDNLPDGCLYRFVLDTQTGTMSMAYASATWEAVTGIPTDMAMENISSVFGAVYPKDLPILEAAIHESAQTMTNFDCEIRVPFGNQIRWVQMTSHPHMEGSNILWDGIILDITARKNAERELMAEKDRLQSLGDNFPNGCLFRFQIIKEQLSQPDALQTWLTHLQLGYASATWEKISNVPVIDAMQNVALPFLKMNPEDFVEIVPKMYESLTGLSDFNVEVRYNYSDNDTRWFQISSHPRHEDEWVITDGFILDITDRKQAEMELVLYREELERLVKERTEELEATNEELYATNEELYATNEELAVTNEELHTKNEQLQHEMTARKEVMMKLEDSESKIRNFIQQSSEGIMMLDDEGRVIEWNEAQEIITGISHKQAIGQYEWDILKQFLPKEEVTEETFNKLRQSRLDYIKVGREQTSMSQELTIYMPDGSKRYTLGTVFPIALAETCYFGRTMHDITEQKMADIELEQYRTQLEQMVEIKTRELVASQERLISLSNNLPGGVIYQLMDKDMNTTWFSYISAYFTDMFGISVEDVMADSSLFYMSIYPEDQVRLVACYTTDSDDQNDIDIEYRIRKETGETRWIHMRSSHHMAENGVRVWDGFMIDITDRKIAEQELEATRKRQNVLINVLQIVQATDNIPDALNQVLSEIGRYVDASRTYVFEKSTDGKTIKNTYEWCNVGIQPEIDNLQEIPVEYASDWFNTFKDGGYVCSSDLSELSSATQEALSAQGIKSILVLPLVANGNTYGFVGYDECRFQRTWDKREIELLVSLSQIISSTTSRYWAETSMRLSQQTMRTVLDNINANIFVTDFDTSKILFANKKIKESIGNDIEGEECWKVMQTGKDGMCDFCPRTNLRDKNNHPTGLYNWEHYNTHTGKWLENTDAAIEWVDGRLVQMEYSTDITDRKAAEEAVRQSEEMYRQLTIASPDAIVVCTPEGHVRLVSPKAMELFGIEEDIDLNNLRLQKYVHSHDRKQAYNMFSALLKDHIAFIPQLLLVRNDGSEFFGEISSATVKDPDEKISSIIMVIRDITQRKLSEMELIRAKEKAEESDKLKSAFLANMSHEIRTPLNGIVGFLNFLATDNLSPKRRQEYISVINNSSAQLAKLIDDIIDVAKIEAKQMNIRPIPFRINELMDELQVFFETYLQANNKGRIALILDDSGFIDSCVTFVDPMRLRQVLNNLIGNAAKFTEKGYIRFGYKQSAPNMLEFVVEDSGIGLAQNQLEVIFERFRQAELSNNRRYGGTGLGLTISRSLVQLMGGDMHVESIEGSGSSFYFTISYLPITREDEHLFDESEEKDSAIKPFQNKTALIVEPGVMKYKYYEKLLFSTGISTIQASNVQQWIDHISQTNHIDTVIADISILEDIKEEELQKIKSIRGGLPVMLIVPEQNDHYKKIILECQFNMTLEEPIDYDHLLEALKKYIR